MKILFLKKIITAVVVLSCVCNSYLISSYASNYYLTSKEEHSESNDFEHKQIEIIKELPSSINIEDMYGRASGQYNLECD